MINLTLMTGIFFNKNFIKAKSLLVLKSDSRQDVNNYRPISVLQALSKIFEKGLSTRLIQYTKTKELFSDSQHGVRSGRSTEYAIT